MVGLVFGAGAIAQAQEDIKSEGNVVQIGHSDKADARPNLPPPGDEDDQPRQPAPKFWIGLLGGAIPADNPLRTCRSAREPRFVGSQHCPEKSGGKGRPEAIRYFAQGQRQRPARNEATDRPRDERRHKKGQITLDILRHGKHEAVNLKPEDRPADAEMMQGEGGGGGFGQSGPMMPGDPFGSRLGMPRPNAPMPFNFRNFGPGVIVGGGIDALNGLPNGVSISIQKQNDQPTHITVSRGSDKWEITGDDPEALKKLPDDLRPTVERMLHGGGGMGGGFGSFHMPNIGPQGPGMGPDMDSGQLREQLERMEKRLDEMQRRMHGPENPPADRPDDSAK